MSEVTDYTEVDKSLPPMTAREVADYLWHEYHYLSLTPLVSICDIWDEIRLGYVYPHIKDDLGVSWETLMSAMAILSLSLSEPTLKADSGE